MRVLLSPDHVDRGLRRIAGELVERPGGVHELVLIGVRRSGIPIAARLQYWLRQLESVEVPTGSVDITLYRDDVATALPNPRIGPSEVPVSLEGRHLVLVDDVSYTGRTTRAAIDALMDYGRPKSIRLAVLIDRDGRELPIQPDYFVRQAEIAEDERIDLVSDDKGLSMVVQPRTAPSVPPPTP